jgi:hypothetical protein
MDIKKEYVNLKSQYMNLKIIFCQLKSAKLYKLARMSVNINQKTMYQKKAAEISKKGRELYRTLYLNVSGHI